LLALAGATEAQIPDLIPSQQPGRQAPAWRSAEYLTTNGLRTDLFTTYELEEIARKHDEVEALVARKVPGERPCLTWTPTISDGDYFLSLEDSTARARAIYAGTLTSVKQGFLYRNPGSLYELRVDRVLKTAANVAPPERLFVYYAQARFQMGEETVCKLSRRGSERPRLGGRLLVFTHFAPDGIIVFTGENALLFDREGGGLSVPHPLHDLEGLDQLGMGFIEDQVAALLAQTAEP
jgi:hypothetical protein